MWYLFLGLQKNCLLKVFTPRVFLFYQQCYFFFFLAKLKLYALKIYIPYEILYTKQDFISV